MHTLSRVFSDDLLRQKHSTAITSMHPYKMWNFAVPSRIEARRSSHTYWPRSHQESLASLALASVSWIISTVLHFHLLLLSVLLHVSFFGNRRYLDTFGVLAWLSIWQDLILMLFAAASILFASFAVDNGVVVVFWQDRHSGASCIRVWLIQGPQRGSVYRYPRNYGCRSWWWLLCLIDRIVDILRSLKVWFCCRKTNLLVFSIYTPKRLSEPHVGGVL